MTAAGAAQAAYRERTTKLGMLPWLERAAAVRMRRYNHRLIF
jgi:hypothetical protein